MNARIEIIPHNQQRYPTVGDWFYEKDGTLVIRVSDLGDDRYNQLIALHEYYECTLCKAAGITQEQVDKFDMDYEANRQPGDESEPGDDPKAPYHRQHILATAIERIAAHEMDVDWDAYADAIEALP